MRRLVVAALRLRPSITPTAAQDAAPVVVASKPFGESYLLAEMFAQLLEDRGIAARRVFGLGSTEIIFSALRSGSIDVYPEYTGTGLVAVLHDSLPVEQLADPQLVFAHVASAFRSQYGVRWLPPLGFENTFAVAVRAETAQKYRLRTLSDLAREGSHLHAGFTADFIDRPDGLAGLSRAYGLRLASVKPLLPALKYAALTNAAVDVIDGFSTDGLLDRYQLVVLADDRHFFPPYEAAAVLGSRAAGRADIVSALAMLSGRLGAGTMRALNRRIEVDGEDVSVVAASALKSLASTTAQAVAAPVKLAGESLGSCIWNRRAMVLRLSLRHLCWLRSRSPARCLWRFLLDRAGGCEPSPIRRLAGSVSFKQFRALRCWRSWCRSWASESCRRWLPLCALFRLRAAYAGVRDADPDAVEAAEALGMTPAALAQGAIAARRAGDHGGVGRRGDHHRCDDAGGVHRRQRSWRTVVTGLAIADSRMVLLRALPAALLALMVDGVLAIVERRLRPAHLRVDLLDSRGWTSPHRRRRSDAYLSFDCGEYKALDVG